MKLTWEKLDGGRWRTVEVADLPEWIKKKKAVLFATRGEVLERVTEDGGRERYRVVKSDGQ